MNNAPHNRTNGNPPPEDDPRVTAFALGELAGEDAAAMERLVGADAKMQREVEAIRALGGSLRAGFAAEPVTTLTATQRGAIMRKPFDASRSLSEEHETAPLNSPSTFRMQFGGRRMAAAIALAAVLALALTAAIIVQFNHSRRDTEFARNQMNARDGSIERKEQEMLGAEVDRELASQNAAQNDALLKKEYRADAPQGGALRSAPGDKQAGEAPPDISAATVEGAKGQIESGADARRSVTTPAPASVAPPPPAAMPSQQPVTPSDGTGRTGGTGGGGGGGAGRGAGVGGAAGGAGAAALPVNPSPALRKPASAVGGQSGPAGTAPSESPATPAKPQPQAKSGDAAGNEGASRGMRSAGSAEPVKLLSDEEIHKMNEPQVQEALSSTTKSRQLNRDSHTDALLRRQSQRLTDRLREVREAEKNAEEYARINDNPFIKPIGEAALSTFAADVDQASYANVRRFLDDNQLPPPDAVRIEEMVNYFGYAYEPPTLESGAPFSASIEVAAAPWNAKHRLVRIGLRGKDVHIRPATSLVFLIDVSGSMDEKNKLPLVKDSLKQLLAKLNEGDRLAIVTYAGDARLRLDSCYVNDANRETIQSAIDELQAGGSTNGAGGIDMAYDIATRNFIKDGVNRVILCTDGDFNVGPSSDEALVRLIEDKRKSNVFLSVLGYGTGNFKDAKMEKLADAGNGNFAYIDSLDEGKRILVKQMVGTLVTIAKDVKLQVEFNPAKVGAYRLIGYEDRLLAAKDFNDDRKDAGEIGAGHMVTALYEVLPAGIEPDVVIANDAGPAVDELEYQQRKADGAKVIPSDNLLTLKIRYKAPEGDKSELLRFTAKDESKALNDASPDFRFAAAAAEFGMLLRHSPHKGDASYVKALDLAEGALGEDRDGERHKFIDLLRKAQQLAVE